MVSAACFSAVAQKTGGATMFARTGEVAKSGTKGSYIVGGQPDRHGQRVPTEYEPVARNADLGQVLHHRRRIAANTDAPNASVGYWRDPEVAKSPYEVDSSAIFNDRRTAINVGKRRGEKSVWDLGKMEDIRLDGKGQRRSA